MSRIKQVDTHNLEQIKKHWMRMERESMATLKKHKVCTECYIWDYKENTIGGVAKVVATHQEMFNKAGVSYICIFPFNISNQKHKKNNRYWGVIVDGED